MKRIRILLLALLILLPAALSARAEAAPEKALTLMVYMTGSNLESQYGSASADLQEMLAADCDYSRVNLLVMTGGSERWKMSFDTTQTAINELGERGSRIVWRGDALNMGAPDTLTALLDYGVENYPAENYALILWNHGGGPLAGVCWDELFSMDNLSLAELTGAIGRSKLPKKLSWIGFDACLMSTAEVAFALSPYAQYMIASQETEPANGWNYGFLGALAADADGAQTGRRVVDAYFEDLGDSNATLTLACTDLSRIGAVAEAMNAFFDPIGSALDAGSFPRLSGLRMASTGFGRAVRGIEDNSYDLVDLADLAARYSGQGDPRALLDALDAAVVYSRASETGAAGLSVYHPYANKRRYLEGWGSQYPSVGLSAGYSAYLERFGALLTGEELADWSVLNLIDEGFGADAANLYSLQLTGDQLASFAGAQLIVLAANNSNQQYAYAAQLNAGADTAATGGEQTACYSPVYIASAEADENGLLTARYVGRSLYVVDGEGAPVAGPVAYQMGEDGQTLYVWGSYEDRSGRDDFSPYAHALFSGRMDAAGRLEPLRTEIYDDATGSYTSRIALRESDYTHLFINALARKKPEGEGALPSFDAWESAPSSSIEIELPLDWHLAFFDEQLSGTPLYAMFQVVDVQQNAYCSVPVPVRNPNLNAVDITPRTLRHDDFDLTLHAVLDTSQLNPGIALILEATNHTPAPASFHLSHAILNDTRVAEFDSQSVHLVPIIGTTQPGETQSAIFHISSARLAEMEQLNSIAFTVTLHYDDLARGDPAYPVRFELENCDVSPIAPRYGQPLAETREADGMRWRLMELREQRSGGLRGVLHVTNNGTASWEHDGHALINGFQTQDELYIASYPGTDAYIPFSVSNVSRAEYMLHITGRDSQYSLAADHLLQTHGVQAVSEVRIVLTYGYDIVYETALALQAPVPLTPSPAGRSGAESRLLAEGGGISARVERVLVADNGFALQLLVRNDSDQSGFLTLDHFDAGVSPLQIRQSMALASHSTLLTCAVLYTPTLEDFSRPVEALRMDAHCFEFTSGPAVIRLNAPVGPGVEGGTFLEPDGFTTDPVRLGYGDVTAEYAGTPLDDVELHLFVNVHNSMDYSPFRDDPQTQRLELTLALEATNHGQSPIDIRFDHITLNGRRSIDHFWTLDGELAPGETWRDEENLREQDLLGISELTQISCAMKLTPDGDRERRTEGTLVFDISGCAFPGCTPAEPPLAGEAPVEDGVTLQLLGLEADEGGGVSGYLKLVNDSDTYQIYHFPYAQFDDLLLPVNLFANAEPGTESLQSFRLDGCVTVPRDAFRFSGLDAGMFVKPDYALQRAHAGPISRLTLLQQDFSACEFALDAPLALADADVEPLEPVVLFEDEDAAMGRVAASLTRLVIGDDGIAAVLQIANDTDDTVLIEVSEPSADGRALDIPNPGDAQLCVPARASAVYCVPFSGGGVLAPGDSVRELRFTLSLGGTRYGIGLVLNDPATMGRFDDGLLDASALTVDPASAEPRPGLLEEHIALNAPVPMQPVTLRAPGEGFEAGEVSSVSALICHRQRVGDTLYDTQLYSLLLGGDDFSAQFPGLLLACGDTPIPVREILLDAEPWLGIELYGFNAAEVYERSAENATARAWLSGSHYDFNALASGYFRLEIDGAEASLAMGVYYLESTDSQSPLLLYALPVDGYGALAIEYQVVRSDDSGAQDVWFIHERLDLEGGSVRLVPAADAGDALVVYYAFEYADGTSGYFIQPYPHREE